jgi:hypothetical protein
MNNDFVAFGIGVGILILYLFLSAWTEMGTKLPWRKDSSEKSSPSNDRDE